jgi:hypothetical protein
VRGLLGKRQVKPEVRVEVAEGGEQNAFTLRAISLGLVSAIGIAICDQYATHVIRGSYMALDFTTPAAIVALFFFALPVNMILRLISPRLVLNQSELALIYIMSIIACAISSMGLGAQLIPVIATPLYRARVNPELGWDATVIPSLPKWLIPNDFQAVRDFFEGYSGIAKLKFYEIPYADVWLPVLIAWFPFLITLYFTMICISILLRRQWVEHERLVYPLVHLPLEMCRRGASDFIAPFFREKLLWLGFSIPFVVSSLIGLNFYFPQVPKIILARSFPLEWFRQLVGITFRLSFPMLGFFYLVNLDVAFSLWFFNLVGLLVRGLLTVYGIEMREDQGTYGAPYVPYKHLGTGALFVLTLLAFWNARGYLIDVVKRSFSLKVIKGMEESYAFLGTIFGFLIMSVWLFMSGMPALVILVFLGYAFVFFIGLVRIVAESGLGEAVAPAIAPPMTVSTLGTSQVGAKGLGSLALTYVWCADIRTNVMASSTHALKIATHLRINRAPLVMCMLASVITTMVVSNLVMLRLGYKYGGVNLNQWYLVQGPRVPYDYIHGKLTTMPGVFLPGYWVRLAGAVITLLLAMARRQWMWWPFHPIGFCVSTIWLMDQIWFTCFLAWMIKGLLLRYGGMAVYVRMRPLFLGLVLGQFACNAVWLIIDAITGKQGNVIFWI